MSEGIKKHQQTAPRKYRIWVTAVLCVLGFMYVVGWVVDRNDLWPLLSIIYFFVALLSWRGSSGGFALASSLAVVGFFGDILFSLLNVLGLYSAIIIAPVLIGFALLQFLLLYGSLRVYRGSWRGPIILILLVTLLLLSSYIQNATASYRAPTIDLSHPQLTTLSQILNGTFRSALDKYGANGTVVEVVNVSVLQVFGALDGDWHLVVTDPPSVPGPFITEILPRDQARLHAPTPGERVTIIGVVYWDDEHLTEAWHGYTGWEIHPVLAWYAIS